MKPFLKVLILSAGACLLTCCNTARRGEPFSGPMKLENEQIADGKRVFQAECHHCHPGGEGGLGPAINNKPLPGFLIAFQIRHGLGTMPEFPREKISDEQLENVVLYLKALRQNDEQKGESR